MGIEDTSQFNTGSTVPAEKAVEDPISANTFRQMLDVLESLATHNHIFYDDYTTVCECQCQCDCSRGTL
jgi:hypothetical protein